MKRDSSDGTGAESGTVPDGRPPLPSLASAPMFQPGSVLNERYVLRRMLGRGGMGVVYEAHDQVLDQALAVKIVRAEYAGERAWAERLAREVKLARQINHPNVCRVFDLGVADGHPFLTMELASGGTLRDEIASGTFAARLFAQRLSDARAIASGLAAIHAAGIIHRDVSPQNILRLADGTLAVSDFGLATDNFDGTSSVHGGTIAYMAPEVVRGARASFASDIWSLGMVIHEVLFGLRPNWANSGRTIVLPALGRIASAAEQAAFEVCRACADPVPARRPRRASEVVDRLGQPRRPWYVGAHRRTWTIAGAAVLAAATAAAGIGLRVWKARSGPAAAGPDPLMIEPVGQPADWSRLSKVLAEVPGRIGCLTTLPDGQSLRFRWGAPPRLDEVDLRTGARRPAPVVPAAYAEGCPNVSPDGRRLLFPGHTAEARPFAFVSDHADGHGAVPVAPIAEPSMLSDPLWLADGDRFAYEIDIRHIAVYSVSKNTTAVLSTEQEDFLTMYHSVVGNRVVVFNVTQQWMVDAQRFSPPSIHPDLRFRLPFFTIWIEAVDDRLFATAEGNASSDAPMVFIDAIARTARPVGYIPGQAVHQPVVAGDRLVFWSNTAENALAIAGRHEIAVDAGVVAASRCGSEIVGTRVSGGRTRLVHLGEDGRIGRNLDIDEDSRLAQCSPDGKVLYYLTRAGALRRCEGAACLTLARDVYGFTLSPDGQTLAVLTLRNPAIGVGLLRASGTWLAPTVLETMNVCPPAWASDTRLWVGTRHAGSNVWTELALPDGVPTGRTAPGQSDCSDGNDDPSTPVTPDVQVVRRTRSQLRFVPGLKQQLRAALGEPARE